MNVLFVCSGNSKFGISPFIKSQGDSLVKKGVKVEYFTIKGKGLFGYLKNIKPLREHLRSGKFDIVHAHYGLCAIVSCMAKAKEKLVVSFMGDDLIGENKFDGSYTFQGKMFSIINRWILPRWVDIIIVKSTAMKLLLRTKKVNVIPNGVNLQVFSPLKINNYKDKQKSEVRRRKVIFVANPERPEKNYALANKSIELLGSDIKLEVLHNINQKELSYCYNSADLLLLTSYHEGSPNVIKEAMACNCPIVSTDVGDVKEIIGDTEGCYITSFEPVDVAEKIKEALAFSISNGRTNGREKLIKIGLDINLVAERILNIYKKLIKL